MHKLARLDHKYVWHPFTQMRDWLRREPIIIVSARGALLRDVRGREYLDANSSIWTNLHGHAHPKINAAIRRQLGKIAHSSALGFANEPASLLAERLVRATRLSPASKIFRGVPPFPSSNSKSPIRNPQLTKTFFSDDGSTALEVALKLAYVFARRSGRRQPKFLSLDGAYHGDTVGAVALGHIELFHKAYSGLLFKTDRVMAPYCYRCPFNRARPERADARDYRKCNHECIGLVEKKFATAKRRGNPYAAFVVEPLMQGAAGMIPQPAGWLRRAAEIARAHGAQIIADEVMTGFGRTGGSSLFASNQEGVQPDFLAVAKGLTGGYLPMAATLTTPAVFDAFLGDYAEFKTFFHGHSFTGNQLGASAALASLDLLQSPASVRNRRGLQTALERELKSLWTLPNVGDIRQAGLVAGVELVHDWRTRKPFDLREQAGIRVCEAMARRGVLTRPVGNVIVLMPPFCTTPAQIARIVRALSESIRETFPGNTV
jgi:adenosylmethionine---8-amino-7-oxononanoate aminotransferase